MLKIIGSRKQYSANRQDIIIETEDYSSNMHFTNEKGKKYKVEKLCFYNKDGVIAQRQPHLFSRHDTTCVGYKFDEPIAIRRKVDLSRGEIFGIASKDYWNESTMDIYIPTSQIGGFNTTENYYETDNYKITEKSLVVNAIDDTKEDGIATALITLDSKRLWMESKSKAKIIEQIEDLKKRVVDAKTDDDLHDVLNDMKITKHLS